MSITQSFLHLGVVVDIEVIGNLGRISKRGVAPRGRGTCEYTLKWE